MLKVDLLTGCHLLHVFQGKIITPAIRPYSKVISRKLYLDSFQFRNSQVRKCGDRLNFLTRIFTFVDNCCKNIATTCVVTSAEELETMTENNLRGKTL